MNIREFAGRLDGHGKNERMSDSDRQIAMDNGFIVIYGSHDDQLDMDGAVTRVFDGWREISTLTLDGLLLRRDSIYEFGKEFAYWVGDSLDNNVFTEQVFVKSVTAMRYKSEDAVMEFGTGLPHEFFNIWDYGEHSTIYCVGIVIDRKDLVEAETADAL